MKVVRHSGQYLVYLAQHEKALLFDLLKLYPMIPPGHFQLSKAGGLPDAAANQQLLEEALAEQRAARKQQLLALLAEPNRCEQVQTGFRIRLSEGDVEWLLQVLNDIRVGSWLHVGSDQAIVEFSKLTSTTLPYYSAMELSGAFQAALLSAVSRAKR